MPKQAPFAVVVGCSDARVPTEMLFGQGFNDLFVIRVAGNVLGDVCMGSIEFALERSEREREVCRRCWATSAAAPSPVPSTAIFGRSNSGPKSHASDAAKHHPAIFVAVRESDNASRNLGAATPATCRDIAKP